MNLSPHFSLEEMTISETAARRGIDNNPPQLIINNLAYTANKMESVRALLGAPIIVSSGYRCPELNEAIGGAKDSAHMDGWAVDFICPSVGDPLDICHRLSESILQWDQVIQEGTWVHISFAPAMRRHVLTKDPAGGYREGL